MTLRNLLALSRQGAFCNKTFRDDKILKSSVRALLSRTSVAQAKIFDISRSYSSAHGFSIQDILPPQDAFALRHIGPRKAERLEMLKVLNLEVMYLL